MKNAVRLKVYEQGSPTVSVVRNNSEMEEILLGNLFVDQEADENRRKVGVVSFFDLNRIDRDQVGPFIVESKDDDYLVFSVRIDEPKVTGAMVKSMLDEELSKWLKENEDSKAVPKSVKAEMKDRIKVTLRNTIPPTPTVYRCAWDLKAGSVLFDGKRGAALDEFGSMFTQLFQLRLMPQAFFYRPGLSSRINRTALAKIEGDAGITAASSAMVSNERLADLWSDFLGWLAYRSYTKKPLDGVAVSVSDGVWLTGDDQLKMTVNANSQMENILKSAFSRGMTIKAVKIGMHASDLSYWFKLNKNDLDLQAMCLPLSDVSEIDTEDGDDYAIGSLLVTLSEISQCENMVESFAIEYLNSLASGYSSHFKFNSWISE